MTTYYFPMVGEYANRDRYSVHVVVHVEEGRVWTQTGSEKVAGPYWDQAERDAARAKALAADYQDCPRAVPGQVLAGPDFWNIGEWSRRFSSSAEKAEKGGRYGLVVLGDGGDLEFQAASPEEARAAAAQRRLQGKPYNGEAARARAAAIPRNRRSVKRAA